eukprot:TRINITY_DN24227_c0_g1_i1.p1 TRINITY_DN24227_c0_g1~~TRINITY_DN24227_c0_g1_i1.p1  ORF type:complete len:1039 (+),score=214.93 TRINITY_DN24227_c0_g1_i1:317-3118(+)
MLADWANSANPGSVRMWPAIVVVVDLLLVAECPRFAAHLLVTITLCFLLTISSEDAWRWGLYSIENWVKPSTDKYCRCAEPPCAMGPVHAFGTYLLYSLTFLLDFYFTRGFASAMRQKHAQIQATVRLAEELAVLLSRYATGDAKHVVDEHGGELPENMQTAFETLLRNLELYRPFLPQSMLPENLDSNESDQDTDHVGSVKLDVDDRTEAWSDDLSDSTTPTKEPSLFLGSPRQPQTTLGVATRRRQASLLLGRRALHQDGADTLSTACQFVEPVLRAVERLDGVVMFITGSDGFVQVMAAWNAYRACSTHSLGASSAALLSVSYLEQTRAANDAQRWVLSAATGSVRGGNIGTADVRAAVLVGAPLRRVCGLADLGMHVGCRAVCDERVFQRVRSDVRARVVDVVCWADGQSSNVYELLSMGSGDVQIHFATGFSALRSTKFEDACEQFAAHLTIQPDKQAARLLRISAYLTTVKKQQPYCRTQGNTYWEDMEQCAGAARLPSKFEALCEIAEQAVAKTEVLEVQSEAGNDGTRLRRRLQELMEGLGMGLDKSLHSPTKRSLSRSSHGQHSSNTSDLRTRSLTAEVLLQDLPTVFSDARGRKYHRSHAQLGKGAFGEVWLGMSESAEMVAVKSMKLETLQEAARDDPEPPPMWVIPSLPQTSTRGAQSLVTGSHHAPIDAVDAVSLRDSGGMLGSASLARPGTSASPAVLKQVAEVVQEVSLLTQLKHDNIVQYLGCACEGPFVLIVMEYVPGGSLSGLSKHFGGRLPETCVRRFFGDIVRGLAYIHSNQIVHRDLKPANVLVAADGQAKLADFGASAELAALGGVDAIAGSPLYMAPEQAQGDAGPASDMWSLAILTYELLTGSVPYGKEVLKLRPEAMIIALAEGTCEPALPDWDAPEELTEIIRQCLARAASERPRADQVLTSAYLLS